MENKSASFLQLKVPIAINLFLPQNLIGLFIGILTFNAMTISASIRILLNMNPTVIFTNKSKIYFHLADETRSLKKKWENITSVKNNINVAICVCWMQKKKKNWNKYSEELHNKIKSLRGGLYEICMHMFKSKLCSISFDSACRGI